MRKLLNTYNIVSPVKLGELVEGTIIGKEGPLIFVDLGPQGTGIIWEKEIKEAKTDEIQEITKGKKIIGKVINLETEDGFIELSIRDARQEAIWQELQKKKDEKIPIIVKILGANKGGLLAKVEGVDAFLPASHLSAEHYPRIEDANPQKILKALQKLVGKELRVNIFSLDPQQKQIILSEKLKEVERKKELLKEFKEGEIIKGEIIGVCDFGAFIRFPAKKKLKNNNQEEMIEGLIHISELDWQLVEDPLEIVKIGEKVKAKVLEIQDEKIFLSLKALKENPWEDIEKEFKKGDIIKGKVKKFNLYGAFVELKPKIQGLCHISEFGSLKKMQEILEIGKTYDFKILLINPEEHKIILGWQNKQNEI